MLQRAFRFALMCLGLLCGAMQAAPMCVPGNLTSYLNLPAGCNVFALRYFTFTFNDNGFESSDNILVTPNNNPASPGLGFSNFTPAGPGVTATFSINYTVDPPPIMAGQRDILDPPFGKLSHNSYCVSISSSRWAK